MKTKAYLLEDPKTGILWMHDYTMDKEYYVKTAKGTIDLAAFKEVIGEFVSFHYFDLCFSPDICVVRNKADGLYTVLIPYLDTMGLGAIYASICEGFAFKSVYGFGQNYEDYIVAQNSDGKWGMYRFSKHTSVWSRQYEKTATSFVPQLIVPFDYDTMDGALVQSGVMFSPQEVLMMKSLPDNSMPGDLTTIQSYVKDSVGRSLKEIQQARKNR